MYCLVNKLTQFSSPANTTMKCFPARQNLYSIPSLPSVPPGVKPCHLSCAHKLATLGKVTFRQVRVVYISACCVLPGFNDSGTISTGIFTRSWFPFGLPEMLKVDQVFKGSSLGRTREPGPSSLIYPKIFLCLLQLSESFLEQNKAGCYSYTGNRGTLQCLIQDSNSQI